MNFIEITKDFCVETEGSYLVRTVSSSPGLPHNRSADIIRFIQARVSRHFNSKLNKWIMNIDTGSQIPTHISESPIPKTVGDDKVEEEEETEEIIGNQSILQKDIEKEAEILYPLKEDNNHGGYVNPIFKERKAYVKGAQSYVKGAIKERKLFKKFLTDFGSKELFKNWLILYKEQNEEY